MKVSYNEFFCRHDSSNELNFKTASVILPKRIDQDFHEPEIDMSPSDLYQVYAGGIQYINSWGSRALVKSPFLGEKAEIFDLPQVLANDLYRIFTPKYALNIVSMRLGLICVDDHYSYADLQIDSDNPIALEKRISNKCPSCQKSRSLDAVVEFGPFISFFLRVKENALKRKLV